MERTLCIQVLGAVGAGKTQLLALITTALRKEGVLIVGTPTDSVCAESVQVKFDAEAHESGARRTLNGYTQMNVFYDDESMMTIKLRNKTVEVENNVYTVYPKDKPHAKSEYEAGVRNVVSIAVY